MKLGGKMLDERVADRIIQRAKELAATTSLTVRAIEIDTERAALGPRQENDEGLGALRIIGERIHAETGATVIWIHHEGKSEGYGPRGILTLADACAVWFRVEERESGDRILFVEKSNRGLCFVPIFAFRLVPFEAGIDKRGKPIILCRLEMTDIETAEQSPVRQRFGGKASKSPAEGKLGDRSKIFLRLLRKLAEHHAGGVPRELLRSHFLLEVVPVGKANGEAEAEAKKADTSFRVCLHRLVPKFVTELNGLLAPVSLH